MSQQAMLQVRNVTAGNVTSRERHSRECYKKGMSQQAMLQLEEMVMMQVEACRKDNDAGRSS